MKRYCVVFHESEDDHSNHTVEFVWASDYSDAEWQVAHQNPDDIDIVAVVRDSVQPVYRHN